MAKNRKKESSTKYGFIKSVTFGEKTQLVGSGFYVEDHLLTKNIGNADNVLIPIRNEVNKCETGKNVDYTRTLNA